MKRKISGFVHILLVDNSRHERASFGRAVNKGNVKCLILDCDCGETALNVLQDQSRKFDVVFVDLGLPDISGIELYKKLQRKTDLPPFILLTARGSLTTAIEALKAGFYDYIIKDYANAYLDLLPIVMNDVLKRHNDSRLRREAEEVLRGSRHIMESEVKKRTTLLLRTNKRLLKEIEQRKRLQADLKQKDEQFGLFMDHFPGSVSIKDTKGKLLFANKYSENVYGWKLCECIGKTDLDLWPKHIAGQIIKDDQQVMKTGQELHKIEHLDVRGQTLSFFTQKFPIFKNDLPSMVGGVSIDISQTIQTQYENLLLISAIENAVEGILILDAEGIIRYLNPAARRSIGGMLSHEPIGNPYYKYIPPYNENIQDFSVPGNPNKPWKGHFTRTRIDDSDREMDVIITPVKDELGKTTNYAVIELDVTEEVKLQKALEQKRKIEALGILAGGIAHDFNNILQPILINAELISDLIPYGVPEREFLDHIIDAVRIGKNLVSQIKLFGYKKKGPFKPIVLSSLIQEALTFIKRSLPPNITFRQKISTKDSLVRADPTQIYQLIINLCMNAVQSIPPAQKGLLGVSLEETSVASPMPAIVSDLKAGMYVKLTVRDTGSGITPDIIDKIFDPFFTTKKASKGTGLGLGVVHEVVNNSEGSILLHTAVGKGTRFEIFLPKYVEVSDMPHISRSQTLTSGEKHILLVDDNTADLWSIHQLLVHLGYCVDSTTDPHEALDIFRKESEKFSLLITDQIMPRMKGHELASQVHQIRKDVPVIVCTGSEGALQELQKHGKDIQEYILKPFSKTQLVDTINRMLS
jgi:PAS domain S-box-containing protein